MISKGHALNNRTIEAITDKCPNKKILIISNHQTLRVSLKDLINRQDDLTVSGEASDMAEACRLLSRDHLDLAIVDRLVWPGMKSRTQGIFPENPTLPVILMTMDNELSQIKIALANGVRGFVTKHDLAEKLIPAMRDVLDGKRYLSPELLEGIPPDVRKRILSGDISD